MWISTLAPTRGATQPKQKNSSFYINFNSRPYTRGDVSRYTLQKPLYYFNSRPYTRGDRVQALILLGIANFNSRPYTRGDTSLYGKFAAVPISTLAPTRGATYLITLFDTLRKISTLAPTRGATCLLEFLLLQWHFNSRPYTRGDFTLSPITRASEAFQLSPLHEGRPSPIY